MLDVSTRCHPLTQLTHADFVSTVNPHDALIRELAYFIGKENLPAVLSIDLVGEIVDGGQVGDMLFGGLLFDGKKRYGQPNTGHGQNDDDNRVLHIRLNVTKYKEFGKPRVG